MFRLFYWVSTSMFCLSMGNVESCDLPDNYSGSDISRKISREEEKQMTPCLREVIKKSFLSLVEASNSEKVVFHNSKHNKRCDVSGEQKITKRTSFKILTFLPRQIEQDTKTAASTQSPANSPRNSPRQQKNGSPRSN